MQYLFEDYEEPLPLPPPYSDNRWGESMRELVDYALSDLRILYSGKCPWDGDGEIEQQIKDIRSLTITPLLKDCLEEYPFSSFEDEWGDFKKYKDEFFLRLEIHFLRARMKRKK